MKIQQINNTPQSNPNFNAKINLSGGGLFKGPKSLLPKHSFDRLEAKAKKIGDDRDIINIDIYNVRQYDPDTFLNLSKDVRTKVYLSHDFYSVNSKEFPKYNLIKGDTNKRKLSAYKLIWKYLDDLEEKFGKPKTTDKK